MTGSGSVISMIPGRYIVAGVQNGGSSGVHLMNMDNAVTVTDQTPQVGGNTVANTDAGEVMVFTDANYTGGNAQDGFRSLYIPSAISNALKSTLVYGDVNIQMGNTAQSLMNLHGLNANATTGAGLPSELTPYAPAVFWQDQGNSKVLYDQNGNIVDSSSCGGGGTLDTPCTNTSTEVTNTGKDATTLFNFQASPGLHMYGLVYQPRGASMNFQGSGGISTPMAIITGDLKMGGSPTVLQPLTTNQLIVKMAALVE